MHRTLRRGRREGVREAGHAVVRERHSRRTGERAGAARRRGTRAAVIAVAASLAAVAAGCGGDGGTKPTPRLVGDYVLLTYDGRNLPAVVASGLSGSETLLSARLEIDGATGRDIKERRRSFLGSPQTTVVDTVALDVTLRSDHSLLLRPTGADAAIASDTATLADGIVENGIMTLRTRSGPSVPAGLPATLVYSRQR